MVPTIESASTLGSELAVGDTVLFEKEPTHHHTTKKAVLVSLLGWSGVDGVNVFGVIDVDLVGVNSHDWACNPLSSRQELIAAWSSRTVPYCSCSSLIFQM